MLSSPTAVALDCLATHNSLAILQQEAIASTLGMNMPCTRLAQPPSAL